MKFSRGAFATIAALLALTACMSLAEAAHRSDCRHGSRCYPRSYVRPYAQNGWFDFRFFGDFRGPCGPLLRKAIEIDTPDPRYWNAYDDCIGL
ncbi:MAG: hypothetical protein ACRD9W_29435 [Terriglobia bacterium]